MISVVVTYCNLAMAWKKEGPTKKKQSGCGLWHTVILLWLGKKKAQQKNNLVAAISWDYPSYQFPSFRTSRRVQSCSSFSIVFPMRSHSVPFITPPFLLAKYPWNHHFVDRWFDWFKPFFAIHHVFLLAIVFPFNPPKKYHHWLLLKFPKTVLKCVCFFFETKVPQVSFSCSSKSIGQKDLPIVCWTVSVNRNAPASGFWAISRTAPRHPSPLLGLLQQLPDWRQLIDPRDVRGLKPQNILEKHEVDPKSVFYRFPKWMSRKIKIIFQHIHEELWRRMWHNYK